MVANYKLTHMHSYTGGTPNTVGSSMLGCILVYRPCHRTHSSHKHRNAHFWCYGVWTHHLSSTSAIVFKCSFTNSFFIKWLSTSTARLALIHMHGTDTLQMNKTIIDAFSNRCSLPSDTVAINHQSKTAHSTSFIQAAFPWRQLGYNLSSPYDLWDATLDNLWMSFNQQEHLLASTASLHPIR